MMSVHHYSQLITVRRLFEQSIEIQKYDVQQKNVRMLCRFYNKAGKIY